MKIRYPQVPITTIVLDSAAAHFHNRLIADNINHNLTNKKEITVNEGVQYMQSLFYKDYLLIYKHNSIKHFNDDGTPVFSGKDDGMLELESYRYDTPKSAKTGIDCYVKDFDDAIDACLTEDTIITTDRGNFKIIDLVGKSGNVKCFDGNKFIYKNFKDVRLTKRKQDIYKLKLSNGYELKGTYDHLILTTKGYKKLGELTEKDKIICN